MKFTATIEAWLQNYKGTNGVVVNGKFIEFNDYIAGLNKLGLRSWEVNQDMRDINPHEQQSESATETATAQIEE